MRPNSQHPGARKKRKLDERQSVRALAALRNPREECRRVPARSGTPRWSCRRLADRWTGGRDWPEGATCPYAEIHRIHGRGSVTTIGPRGRRFLAGRPTGRLPTHAARRPGTDSASGGRARGPRRGGAPATGMTLPTLKASPVAEVGGGLAEPVGRTLARGVAEAPTAARPMVGLKGTHEPLAR